MREKKLKMNREEFLLNYWNYYLALEKKFINSTNYVAVNEDNYDTYSFEFVNLILLVGSELDITMKLLSDIPHTEKSNIQNYADHILTRYPDIVSREVKIQGIDLPRKPFDGWNQAKPSDTLIGWNAYNNVKHGRVANIKDAKLECVLNLLTCLYITEYYLLKKITDLSNEMDMPDEDSKVFSLLNWHRRYISAQSIILEEIEDAQPIVGGGRT